MGTALITGAGGGIGQALCQAFQRAGYDVIGLDRPGVPVPVGCRGIVADLEVFCRDGAYRQRIEEEVRSHLSHASLKVLINNAAMQVIKPTEALTPKDWHSTLDVNLVAPCLLAQVSLPSPEAA